MLVYIIHSDKIYTFKLPRDISGSFILHDFDSNNTKRNLLSITSNNNEWIFKSHDEVKIIENNDVLDECKVEIYKFYRLKVARDENVLLYVAPGYNNDFINKDVLINSKINSNSSDISYKIPETLNLDIDLLYDGTCFYVKNNNTKIPIFVNSNLFIEGKLDNFDELFIMGLKIILVGKTILISGDRKNIFVSSNNLVDEVGYLAAEDIEYDNTIYNNFFDSEDFFSKSPVFKKKINTEVLDISSPTPKEERYHSSILMDIIPSGLMCLTSVLSGYFTIKSCER